MSFRGDSILRSCYPRSYLVREAQRPVSWAMTEFRPTDRLAPMPTGSSLLICVSWRKYVVCWRSIVRRWQSKKGSQTSSGGTGAGNGANGGTPSDELQSCSKEDDSFQETTCRLNYWFGPFTDQFLNS
jgi:hypothetical protein